MQCKCCYRTGALPCKVRVVGSIPLSETGFLFLHFSFIDFLTLTALRVYPDVHCKNCGVLCPPNEQHTIGGISHQPLKVCLAHLIWCARS